MNNADSKQIVERFFAALRKLKARKIIRGKNTFTERYGINRWNLNSLEKRTDSGIFQPGWLTYLVRDYGVSSLWLLTGEGPFFAATATNTGIDPDLPEHPKRKRGRPRKTYAPPTN